MRLPDPNEPMGLDRFIAQFNKAMESIRQPLEQISRAAQVFGKLNATMDSVLRSINAMCWTEYRAAGMPYGETEEGMARWLREEVQVEEEERAAWVAMLDQLRERYSDPESR